MTSGAITDHQSEYYHVHFLNLFYCATLRLFRPSSCCCCSPDFVYRRYPLHLLPLGFSLLRGLLSSLHRASQAHRTLPSAVPHPLASLVDEHGPVWWWWGRGEREGRNNINNHNPDTQKNTTGKIPQECTYYVWVILTDMALLFASRLSLLVEGGASVPSAEKHVSCGHTTFHHHMLPCHHATGMRVCCISHIHHPLSTCFKSQGKIATIP